MPQSISTGIVVEIKKDMEFTNAAGKTYKGVRFTYSDDKTGDIKAQKFHENVMKYSPEVAKGINTLVKDDEFSSLTLTCVSRFCGTAHDANVGRCQAGR